MRYWYDFEFVERGPGFPLVPISLGMVAEDGRELEMQWANNLPVGLEHPWVRQNVLPKLKQVDIQVNVEGDVLAVQPRYDHVALSDGGVWVHNPFQAERWLTTFCDIKKYGKPEFWGYYCDYDHILLCQIFGRMMNLPEGWPMYTMDIKQEQKIRALRGESPTYWVSDAALEHNALEDARDIRSRWLGLFPEGLGK